MNQRISNVTSVELIGHDEDLKWENHGDGLHEGQVLFTEVRVHNHRPRSE